MAMVRFQYADVRPLRIKDKKAIKEFVIGIFAMEDKLLSSLSYIFCSDDYLLQMNRNFLRHDYYTDIITFDLSEGEEIAGEVYISVDRVLENSITHKSTFRNELLRVIFHGALHLLGYKDKKKSEITVMREKEDHYLRLFDAQ